MGYVVTNGHSFLSRLSFDGKGLVREFMSDCRIVFDTDLSAQCAMCLAFGVDQDNDPFVPEGWCVQKLTKVKPRVIVSGVSRKWAKAYIRCRKAADSDGYIYCKDCVNSVRHLPFCSTDPKEFGITAQ